LKRYGRALAIALPLFVLLISQAKAWSYQQLYSESVQARLPIPSNWVARATPRQVAMVIASDADPTTVYQSEFWNPNVNRAYMSAMRPLSSRAFYSPTCPLRLNGAGVVGASDAPGCSVVPRGWLVQSDSFAMHLRDEVKRLHPNNAVASTLMLSAGRTQVLSMVGGRNVRGGVVERELEVRTYSLQPGMVRIFFAAAKRRAVVRAAGEPAVKLSPDRGTMIEYKTARGTQLKVFSIGQRPGSPNNVKVTDVEFREGGGPWRSIK
jgi:hypothetical protein